MNSHLQHKLNCVCSLRRRMSRSKDVGAHSYRRLEEFDQSVAKDFWQPDQLMNLNSARILFSIFSKFCKYINNIVINSSIPSCIQDGSYLAVTDDEKHFYSINTRTQSLLKVTFLFPNLMPHHEYHHIWTMSPFMSRSIHCINLS